MKYEYALSILLALYRIIVETILNCFIAHNLFRLRKVKSIVYNATKCSSSQNIARNTIVYRYRDSIFNIFAVNIY